MVNVVCKKPMSFSVEESNGVVSVWIRDSEGAPPFDSPVCVIDRAHVSWFKEWITNQSPPPSLGTVEE